MALSIRNARVEELARLLAFERGESLTDAILEALEARLAALRNGPKHERDFALIDRLGARVAALPDLDPRKADEILGYDETGLPG